MSRLNFFMDLCVLVVLFQQRYYKEFYDIILSGLISNK